MDKKLYTVCAYTKNPAVSEVSDEFKADHTFGAKGKRQLIGILTTLVDNFSDVEYIEIFKTEEVSQ